MKAPSAAKLFAAVDATWPAARLVDVPGWRVREGQGGGQRVSAATATAPDADIDAMEAAHAAIGQRPLVMVRPEDGPLDARLEAAGYQLKDPVLVLACPVPVLAIEPPPVTAFHVAWPPLRIQAAIWEASGIGPARLAVMERAAEPRVAVLGRAGDVPAGTAFAAIYGRIAMTHALEVSPPHRRNGTARHIMQGAALWAKVLGAQWMAVLVTKANAPARALYASLGLQAVEEYHYRVR